MKTKVKLTRLQKITLLLVYGTTRAGTWYRAGGHGERVTLASLHTRGLLQRQAHRGVEGAANAAYEYQVTPNVFQAFADLQLR